MKTEILDKIYDIGQIVDELDEYSMKLPRNTKDFSEHLISEIENGFRKFNIQEMSSDEIITYKYTHSNYQAIIRRLAGINFDKLKNYSELAKNSSDKESFLINNHADRIEEYRQAIALIEAGTDMSPLYITQVYINLANLLLEMGRVVESVEELKRANTIVRGFPMARGNLAAMHDSLARRITDKSIKRFLCEKGLEESRIAADSSTPELVPFDIMKIYYEWELYFEREIFTAYKDDESWEESLDINEQYKIWCSKNYLSLNYINIIYPYGNIDDIHIPDMGLGYFRDSNNMEYYAWENTIKQEFNMARYFLYQVDTDKRVIGINIHESQSHNVLINTLDYPSVGYRTELLKSSLRTAFGVLDKIGMMCCHFHKVNMNTRSINFQSWYREIKLDIALGSPFNALYWMSQDLDRGGALKDIRHLRNYLEHRYIRVLESTDKSMSEEFADETKFEYIVSYSDLKKKAFEMLRIVRSAIFYMIFGFNIEYMTTISNLKDNEVFIPLTLSIYEDEWKD